MGKRGEANDADSIRLGKAEGIVNVLNATLPKLRERILRLKEHDRMRLLLNNRIGDLDILKDYIEKNSDSISNTPANLALWSALSVAAEVIHLTLEESEV